MCLLYHPTKGANREIQSVATSRTVDVGMAGIQKAGFNVQEISRPLRVYKVLRAHEKLLLGGLSAAEVADSVLIEPAALLPP